MPLFNSHLHTLYSHDSSETIEAHCQKALLHGFGGFAVTDHCDCEYSENPLVLENITASFDAAAAARSAYADTLRIAVGAEVGDALFDPLFAEKVLKARKWDVILGSVHAVRFAEWSMPFSCIDFSDKSDEFISEYLFAYFRDMEEMLDKTDFDVLAHLTIPLRYIIKKYGREVDVERYYPQIENILRKTVAAGKTLEINTSNYSPADPFFMPDERIVDTYLSLGGKDFTLGSDAHSAEHFDKGMREAAAMLKGKGIDRLVYYLDRKKIYYSI